MRKALLCIGLAFCFAACNYDKLEFPVDQMLINAMDNAVVNGDHRHYLLPEPNDLASIPHPAYNSMTASKVELGKQLFFETSFSIAPMHDIGEATYSCASCHVPAVGFMPGRIQGIGDGGVGFGENGEERGKQSVYDPSELDVQGIRPLSLVNTAYVRNTGWSGQFGAGLINEGTEDRWGVEDPGTQFNNLGFEGLETQNIAGIILHRMVFTQEIVERNGYTELFDLAFPDLPTGGRYTTQTASFALSAYLRSVLTNRAPFQEYLRGDRKALSDQEKQGALLFFGKAGCYRCHSEPNLGSVQFYAMGANDLVDAGAFNTDENDKKNFGRGVFTGLEEDNYKFKIPQLYNLKDASFLLHGSSKTSIREVVEYFNRGIPENPRIPANRISPLMTPLDLSDQEVEDLTAFLEHGLYDDQMDRYVPTSVLSGNCFPNNDAISRADLGCE